MSQSRARETMIIKIFKETNIFGEQIHLRAEAAISSITRVGASLVCGLARHPAEKLLATLSASIVVATTR